LNREEREHGELACGGFDFDPRIVAPEPLDFVKAKGAVSAQNGKVRRVAAVVSDPQSNVFKVSGDESTFADSDVQPLRESRLGLVHFDIAVRESRYHLTLQTQMSPCSVALDNNFILPCRRAATNKPLASARVETTMQSPTFILTINSMFFPAL
jgi:hypothetical protein